MKSPNFMVIDRSFKVNGSKWSHFQCKKPKCNGKRPIFRGNDQRFRLKSLNFRESRNHRTAKIPSSMFKKKRVCFFRKKEFFFFSNCNGRNNWRILSEDLTHIKIILGKFEN